jgi:hypothetical protein
MTVLLAIFLASILLLFSSAMYMVDTAATVPLATSPTAQIRVPITGFANAMSSSSVFKIILHGVICKSPLIVCRMGYFV